MPIYTVGRRRVIIALILTGALLLTLDLRGNAVLDAARDGFVRAMSPVERAANVVTQPVERLWNSYSNYDDLERENLALRNQIDRQRGTQAAAEASIIDYQLLLALNKLPSLAQIETAKAQVVGGASNNIDQTVEINKGTNDGIEVGMAVVNQAGLVGKITRANVTTSTVMLVTDPRYSISVEILAGTGEDGGEEPANTTPSGQTAEDIDDRVAQSEAEEAASVTDATAPTGTSPADIFAGDVPLPQAGDPNDPANTTTVPGPPATDADGNVIEQPPTTDADGNVIEQPPATDADGNVIEVPPTTAPPTTLPPEPDQPEKEFGVLQGRGQGRPPQVSFLQDIPSIAELKEGDLIETAGGEDSLAPPDIPVGTVINRADRAGVAGPLLEIELIADLDKLNFVNVVLFQPLAEVAQSEVAE